MLRNIFRLHKIGNSVNEKKGANAKDVVPNIIQGTLNEHLHSTAQRSEQNVSVSNRSAPRKHTAIYRHFVYKCRLRLASFGATFSEMYKQVMFL